MTSVEAIELLWDYYTQKKFLEVVQYIENIKKKTEIDENILEIYLLSSLEIEQKIQKSDTKGIFKELLSAMNDYYNQNYFYCAKKLARWILNKKFYSEWIIDRFYESANISNQHELIIEISLTFLKRGLIKVAHVHNAFLSFYAIREYEKALHIFETYREIFDENDLYTVGLILLKLKRYKEAERILIGVYKRLTGKEYQNRYEKIESYYKNKYKDLKEKYIANQLKEPKELTEYGMACLFSGDYRMALQIFTRLKNQMEKAA